MDYKLERKIYLNENTKHKSLYDWCLNEIDESNKKVDSDLIPWRWSLYFIASSLRVVREIEIERSYQREEQEKKLNKKTKIVGILHSGYCKDGKNLEQDVSYSMFGTNRKIKDFEICIYPNSSDEDKEACSLWGYPSYDCEIDYRNETSPDLVGFNLFLNEGRFNEFVSLIESKKVDVAIVRVGGVSGFYSNWSPAVSAEFVKILTSSHVVETSDKSKVQPPKLGSVDEFSISFITFSRLKLKQNFQPIDVDKVFYDSEIIEDRVEDVGQESSCATSRQSDKAENVLKIVSSLKLPLWFIFGALILLLIK